MPLTTQFPGDQPQTVLILGATYATGNMGVDALLSGSAASVWHSDPDGRVVVLDYGAEPLAWTIPSPAGEREITLINLRFSWKLWLSGNGFRLLALAMLIRMLPIPSFRNQMIAKNPVLSLIRNATVALSLAGGDSFSDIYGFRRLMYVSLPQLLVLAMGRPLVLLPQTLGPFKAGWAKWLGRFIMKRARLVYSRDQASLDMARELLGADADHVRLSLDMAFALTPSPPLDMPEWESRKDRPLVGLNVSGLLYMGGYNRSNMFGIHVDYPKMIRNLVRWFIETAETDVVLMAHVTGKREGDENACDSLYEDLKDECGGRLHLADSAVNHREIKYLIGKCDFFLGSRMHACIAALSQEVPAVGLAYSRKFAGVFETVGVEDLVVDLRDLNEGEVLERVESLFHRRKQFAGLLRQTIPSARTAALNLLSHIADSGQADVMRRPLPWCAPLRTLLRNR
jgi:colanic acid/amylovoran biosynthesis protein